MVASESKDVPRWALPLLLCSSALQGRMGPHPLDRIRLQKAIFLVTRRGASAWSVMYVYEPYNWGPYSRALADDVGNLQSERLIRTVRREPNTYPAYRLTSEGEAVAEQVIVLLDESELDFIAKVRMYVTCRDFNSLLREVYAAYPAFASQSRWAGRQ